MILVQPFQNVIPLGAFSGISAQTILLAMFSIKETWKSQRESFSVVPNISQPCW